MGIMGFMGGMVMRTPWGLSAVLYAVGGLLLACIGLGVTIKVQGARLEVAKVRVHALGEEIASQNRAVAAWKAEASKQASRALDAAKRAERVRTVTVDRVRTVTVAAIPPTCPGAIEWGAEHALEFVKEWEDEGL